MILPDQLSPKVVCPTETPTVSGQIPTWISAEEEYLSQIPFTNELLGKPLASQHPTVSGQVIQWTGADWKPVSINSINGPLTKRAIQTSRLNIAGAPSSWTKLPGMSIVMPTETGDVLELKGFVQVIQTNACTLFIGYTVDNGIKNQCSWYSQWGGWWVSIMLYTIITDLTPGTHTIEIWAISDNNSWFESGTNLWYTEPGPISQFSIKRIKAQT